MIPSPPFCPVPDSGPAHTSLPRALGALSLIGIATFAVVCAAVQVLRRDYDWLQVPLSFYVLGRYGGLVEASYFALAPGLAALGVGWYLALDRKARSVAPLLLFVCAAIALCITAAEFTDVPNGPHTLHGTVHVLAAMATFLCVTVAMLLESWRLRFDAHWRNGFRSAFALAVVAFIALWLDALVKSIPRGLGEKIVIALILVWLARAAWWLARRPRSGTMERRRTMRV